MTLSRTPEHQQALHDFEVHSASLLKAEEEKEFLVNQLIPELNSIYLSRVGKLKLELLKAQGANYRAKRKKEMILANINRQVPVNMEAIDVLIELEMKEINAKLDVESKRLDSALVFLSMPKLNIDEQKELKSLYYKLSKLLHPDLNPDQSEDEKLFWLKVSEAFRSGDLTQLQFLDFQLKEKKTPENITSNLEELKKRNAVLQQRIKTLTEQIEQIKSRFPVSIAHQIKDDAWIEMQNKETLSAIANTVEETRMYENEITTLLE